MRAKYFRYLFENQDNGLVHLGCVYDREKQKTTNYIYIVGNYCSSPSGQHAPDVGREKKELPEHIDILVVGGYTAEYLKKLISLVKAHEITTIILPYFAPVQRLVLVEELKQYGQTERELVHFLQDPYLFLKQMSIENIYFLYRNGAAIKRAPEELEQGCHFEPADRESLQLIHEMEGCAIPVVRAGYIIENDWLFYFGAYGIDIQILSGFTRDYFSHLENIHKVSENADEDYLDQMKRLIQEYKKRFGISSSTTVVMFQGPLFASLKENDSYMSEKEFDWEERCETWQTWGEGAGKNCSISCMHFKDHDVMQHHKNKEETESRFGLLLLGNVNLNRYFPDIMDHFRMVRSRIRGIAVPGCGCSECWNHLVLCLTAPKNRMYWICNRSDLTSAGVVSDIVLSSHYNRFLSIDEDMGACFSGYLIPREEIV